MLRLSLVRTLIPSLSCVAEAVADDIRRHLHVAPRPSAPSTFVTRAAQVSMPLSPPVRLTPLSCASPCARVISRCRFEQVYSHVQPMASPLAGLQGSRLPAPAARRPPSNSSVRQDQNRGLQPGGGHPAKHQRLHHTAYRPHYRGALHERWANPNCVIVLRDQ